MRILRKEVLSFLLVVAVVCFVSVAPQNVAYAQGQTSKQEIFNNVMLSAGDYCVYPEPVAGAKLTPAPKGYKPFYMSHYGRHGSRWLISTKDYTLPHDILHAAHDAGNLTQLGEDVMLRMDMVCADAFERYGELTPKGAAQHRGIAKRMTENFPEIFSGDAKIDARSTVVIRCILSMEAECQTIKAFNPAAEIKNDASDHDMYYMNYYYKQKKDGVFNQIQKDSAALAKSRAFEKSKMHPDRFMLSLFKDTSLISVDKRDLFSRFFRVASDLQDTDLQISMYDLFTKEELYGMFCANNAHWYFWSGYNPLSKSLMPFSQTYLLKDIIKTADSVIATGSHGATLRFGHDSDVMPLSCLMELNDFAVKVSDLDSLADKWPVFRNVPMATNVQMIFYRNANGDVIVKVLHNEREAKLPIGTKMAPYYKWEEVKNYYLKKLEKSPLYN